MVTYKYLHSVNEIKDKSWPKCSSAVKIVIVFPLILTNIAFAKEAIFVVGHLEKWGGLIPSIKSEIGRVYQIDDDPDIPHLEQVCTADDKRLTMLLSKVREGTRLFYQEVNVDGAIDALSQAMSSYVEKPCITANLGKQVTEICAAGVLLVRCLLYTERYKEAGEVAKIIVNMFPESLINMVDAPPEVVSYLNGLRSGLNFSAIGLIMQSKEDVKKVFVNGVQVDLENPLSLPHGIHHLNVFLNDGSVIGKKIISDNQKKDIFIDIDLARITTIGTEGVVYLDCRSEEDCLRHASMIGTMVGKDVILVLGNTSEIDVLLVKKTGEVMGKVLVVTPEDTGEWANVVVDPNSPFVRKPVWPWPWITMGVSAGILASGLLLNYTANQDAKKVSLGSNRIKDYHWHKWWAIGCYIAGGVGVATGFTLLFLKPNPKESFRIGPVSDINGTGLMFSGTF